MNTPREVGNYIKLLRKSKELTQEDVAEKMGIKTNTYAQFESGRTNMTLATINKIAEALGYEAAITFTLKG